MAGQQGLANQQAIQFAAQQHNWQQAADPRYVCRTPYVTAPRSFPDQQFPPPCMRILPGPPPENTSRCIDRFRPYQRPPPPPTMGYEPCGTIGASAYNMNMTAQGPCGPIPPPKPIWPCEALPKQPCKKPIPPEEKPKEEGEEGGEEGAAGEGGGGEEGGEEGEEAGDKEGKAEETLEDKCGRIPKEEKKPECRYKPYGPLPKPKRDELVGYIPCGDHPPLPQERVCAMFDPARQPLPLPFDPEKSVPIQLARKICLPPPVPEDLGATEEVYCPDEDTKDKQSADMLGEFKAEVTINEVFVPRPPPGYPPFPPIDCCMYYHQMESIPEPIMYSPCYLQFVQQGYTRDR